jgi:hypothetical protein
MKCMFSQLYVASLPHIYKVYRVACVEMYSRFLEGQVLKLTMLLESDKSILQAPSHVKALLFSLTDSVTNTNMARRRPTCVSLKT